MDNKVKALLLGVTLHMRECENGGWIIDAIAVDRQKRLTAALDRLTIVADRLQPNTLSTMLDSGDEVLEWLASHPQARVTLGYWTVSISSPEFTDVNWERFDWPFGLNGAVEEFHKDRDGDGWSCCWSLG